MNKYPDATSYRPRPHSAFAIYTRKYVCHVTTAAHTHFDRNHQNICLMLRPTGLQLTVILTIHLGLVQGMSINILPSATNRSKPNNYLFYNRIPKCGSSTAMKYMRHLSFNLSYAWIGKKVTTLPNYSLFNECLSLISVPLQKSYSL